MNKSLIVGLVVCGSLGWALQSGAISRGGKGYRIQFTGKPGARLMGGVSWKDMKKPTDPMHVDKIDATLPHSVNLNVPDGSIVSATGMTLGKGDVTIKIYHNDVECGREAFVGSGAMGNKVCQP
jgi:hypothetical protein